MPLVTSEKSCKYTPPTGRNYAVSYWRKILHINATDGAEITPLVTDVKSYKHYRPEEITPLVAGVKSYI